MKRFFTLLALAGIVSISTVSAQAAPDAPKPDLTKPAPGKAIPDQYIVVLKDTATTQSIAQALDIKTTHVYTSAINGFAAKLNAEQLKALQHNPNVAYVEQDNEISIDKAQLDTEQPQQSQPAPAASIQNTQLNPPWGLDRIDQRYLPLSGSYTSNNQGYGVRVYVIDSGVDISHSEFSPYRASSVYDVFGGDGLDCYGRGTYAAGIIGGNTYGVAKQVQIRSLRVFNCAGQSTESGFIAAVDWLRTFAQKPAVANISFVLNYSLAVNTAISRLNNSGVFTVVAAGEALSSACNYSPAGADGVVTVARATMSDAHDRVSNYGPCVELYAPSENIPSAWLNGGTSTRSTSWAAAAHAAGVAALYKSVYGDTSSANLASWMIDTATPNVLSGVPAGTPNRLLHKPWF